MSKDFTKRIGLVFGAIVTAAGILAGCSGLDEPRKSAEKVQARATQLRDENVASATSAAVQRTSRPRISGEKILLRSSNRLPDVFSTPVEYSTHGAQGFSEVLEAIGSLMGMPMRGVEILEAQKTGAMSGMSGQMPGAQSGFGKLGGSVVLDYAGTFRGLCDELAALRQASWRYDKRTNSVNFFRFETRVLSVNLPPGAKSVAASISLTGAGGAASGGSGAGDTSGGSSGAAGNVSVTQTQLVDPWTSIMNGVQSILSVNGNATGSTGASGGVGSLGGMAGGMGAAGGMSGGAGTGGGARPSAFVARGADGEASATPELGMLTVTARPIAVERIAAYVDSVNRRFGQNVMVDIQVLSVTMDNSSQAGFSMDLLYKKLNGNGLSVVGGAPLQPANGTPGRWTFTNADPNSSWSGSSMVAEALAQYGTVGLETKAQVLAINGQPAPFQVAEEIGYLAKTTVAMASNAGTLQAAEPGSRVVGFTGNITPTIMGDNRILLQYQMDISSMTLTQASTGTTVIQTPRVAKQSLQNQAYVRDGELIVLFGFDQNRNSVDSSLGLGGASRTGRGERKMLVIVMQVSGGKRRV